MSEAGKAKRTNGWMKSFALVSGEPSCGWQRRRSSLQSHRLCSRSFVRGCCPTKLRWWFASFSVSLRASGDRKASIGRLLGRSADTGREMGQGPPRELLRSCRFCVPLRLFLAQGAAVAIAIKSNSSPSPRRRPLLANARAMAFL